MKFKINLAIILFFSSFTNSIAEIGYGVSEVGTLSSITGIEETNKTTFLYNLGQNYPNPFNPITTIEYQLPKTSQVDLSIYNILGQKIAKLVSEKQISGKYTVEWDASGFASGVYLYKLETENGYSQVKKLVLLK